MQTFTGPLSARSCFLVAVLTCVTLSQTEGRGAAPTQPGIRTLRNALSVRPDFATGTLHAKSSLTVSNMTGEELRAISVILYHMLEVTGVQTAGGRALPFTQKVVPFADFKKMRVRHIQVSLQKPLPPASTLSLDTSYGGRLAGYVETGQAYVQDRISSDFTILRPECLAYPIVSSPSAAALKRSLLSHLNQGWDYSVDVTVPEGYVVANGGRLVGKKSVNGEVTYSYRNIKPAWRIDVCIAKYGIMEENGGSARLFFLPHHEPQARRVYGALAECAELLSGWFGPRPALEGLTVIEVPKGYGSQTDFTCILQDAEAFQGPLRHLYHEVSHLWNPPPRETNSCRFETEGLACFLEHLLTEVLESKPGSLEQGMRLCRARFRAQVKRNPKCKDVPMADYGRYDCTDASYTKGAIAFWLLYRIVGHESFIEIYRGFCQEYGDKGATLEDFVTTVKTASAKDLERYFDEWIYGAQSSEHLLSDLSPEQMLRLYVVED